MGKLRANSQAVLPQRQDSADAPSVAPSWMAHSSAAPRKIAAHAAIAVSVTFQVGRGFIELRVNHAIACGRSTFSAR